MRGALFYFSMESAMQGHPEVVECLIKLLRGELAARVSIFSIRAITKILA